MSEETVRHWKMRMLDWAQPLAMADDQALWDQFLAQFRAEYADTQRGDRARETIDNIKMKGIASVAAVSAEAGSKTEAGHMS